MVCSIGGDRHYSFTKASLCVFYRGFVAYRSPSNLYLNMREDSLMYEPQLMTSQQTRQPLNSNHQLKSLQALIKKKKKNHDCRDAQRSRIKTKDARTPFGRLLNTF